MNLVIQKNIAALITPRLASAFTSVTAGGAGDNTAVVGPAIQRSALSLPLSAAAILLWTATLAATRTLFFGTVKIQHSDDGSTNWTDFSVVADPGIVATGPAGGATVTGQTKIPFHLTGAKDWIRLAFTPDLSAANTDVATIVAALVLAGEDRLPSAA